MAGLTATLFWGLSFVGVRVALEAVTPVGLVALRVAIATPLLFLAARARGGALVPGGRDGARVLLLGAILAVHLAIQAVAMRSTTAIRAGWFVAFIPVVVAVGAALLLRERMRAAGWLGVALASAGVLVLSAARPADLAGVGRGDALMLVSCFTWAAYTLISVPLVRRHGSRRVALGAFATAVVPCLGWALVEGLWIAPPGPREWAAVLFLGLFSSGLAFLAFGRAVAVLGAQRTSAFLYLQPFVTLCGSRLLLGEPFTSTALLGGVLVLAGVAIVQHAKRGLA